MPRQQCSMMGCTAKLNLMEVTVGSCKHCSSAYCLKHRLPESHVCPQLKVIYDEAHKANGAALEANRVVVRKVSDI